MAKALDCLEMKPFDPDAQARITALFRTCPPGQFRDELNSYEPRSRSEHVTFHLYQGWALYDDGEYRESRPHLLRSLRGSERSSKERSLAHGLLAESYLRIGQFSRAERCARRALSEGCDKDPGHFIQAGHLLALGRIQSQSGHVTHGIETCRRALDLVTERSPHWVPLLASIAQGHYYRGEWEEAEAALRQARIARGRHRQGWVIASVECPLALALGDMSHAEQVAHSAVQEFYGMEGDRVRFVLDELQASVLHAQGRYDRSEQLLRGILGRATLGGSNSDAVASAARALAESLTSQSRYEEAIQVCRIAASAGGMDDRIQWAAALRLQAECHLALGAHDAARRAFGKALSVHAIAQFDVERSHLQQSLRRASFRGMAGRRVPRALSPQRVIRRLTLASGRVFLSCDDGLVDAIRTASHSSLPVLIEGETGTGKELVANLIHEMGPRSSKPIVVVDCTSLPELLADVELFGAARGAYTGALRERAGLVAQADGGTLLLDELPELTPALQAKLLRVIQEGQYRRIGEDRLRRVQVRFIATTNRSVQYLLDSGALKADLYYRLSGHRISLQPLRDRPWEIGPLAAEAARRAGLGGISRHAVAALEENSWPGNARQLEMVVRLAATSCGIGSVLDRARLEPHLRPVSRPSARSSGQRSRETTLRGQRAAAERALLERMLGESGGVVSEAARSLGISRQSLYKALRRTGLR